MVVEKKYTYRELNAYMPLKNTTYNSAINTVLQICHKFAAYLTKELDGKKSWQLK